MPYLDALLKPLISKSNKTAIIIDVLSNTIITLLVRALIVQIWRNNVIILLFSVKSVGWGGSVALSIFFGLLQISKKFIHRDVDTLLKGLGFGCVPKHSQNLITYPKKHMPVKSLIFSMSILSY